MIAIIDRDPATRKSTEMLLSSFGFNIELYGSSEEFLSASAATQARCLVVSIELDHISGIELVRYLRQAGVNIPTVYVSTIKDDAARLAAMQLDCVAFLEKPFGSAQLIEAVAAATGTSPIFER